MNRYGVVRGVTPYELVHKQPYSGAIATFAEPVFGYYRVGAKGTAKWRRALFLGKVDGQDSYILYSGHQLVLTRSIRRIDSDWKNHLAFYSTFRCSSWEYKSGFGGRVVPTKIKREALSVGFQLPQGEIEPSSFHDAEGEEVREKAREELREESERIGMGEHDERRELPAVEDDAPPEVSFGAGVEDMEDGFRALGDEVDQHENPEHRELAPVQQRHMFTVEQANRVAMNAMAAMGHFQYMSTIRHQSRGFIRAGDDTDGHDPAAASSRASNDVRANNEQEHGEGSGESESYQSDDHLLNPARDLSTRQGEIETTIDDWRLQLNVALAEEHWSDADEIQRTILMILDNIHNQGMRDPQTRLRVFGRNADSFQRLAAQGDRHGMSAATIVRSRT